MLSTRGMVLAALMFSGFTVRAAEFAVIKQEDRGVAVTLDGKTFTEYLIKSGHKPVLFPLIGPGGHELTRRYPLQDALETERSDHIHHRSFWFTHGDVNGIDFWGESDKSGHILHREFLKVRGGETALISTRNDWVDTAGVTHCSDVRTLTFGADTVRRWIDFDITITGAREVKFGDTKEGSFGIRLAGTMKVDAKPGGKIINSEGQTDKGAWGKAAKWVDYVGPVDGNTVGVAILNHPSSFRFPTHWHVRTYGLFAANPFGLHHFYGDNSVDAGHTLKKGESFSLHYRVLLHHGDTGQGKVAEAYAEYAETDRDLALGSQESPRAQRVLLRGLRLLRALRSRR
ncbi:MAG: hypothetical protein CMJ59_01205 [Planctomycetaceae bacterium]|nr:hypothetical protein [Planctomycetaceae bacterium]